MPIFLIAKLSLDISNRKIGNKYVQIVAKTKNTCTETSPAPNFCHQRGEKELSI